MRRLPNLKLRNEYIAFAGGFDTETPPIVMKPGHARATQNFEQAINGGYQTIAGYERYSGKLKPSEATYVTLACSSIDPAVAVVGAVIVGVTSAKTGTIISVGTTYLVVAIPSGTFVAETVNVGATFAAVVTGYYPGGFSVDIDMTLTLAAQNVARGLIAAVPGSGKVLGVWEYNDKRYAFRNASNGLTAVMHVSSITGWTVVPLGKELAFTAGGSVLHTAIVEGATITGATSTATATANRVILVSGSWALGTAVGRIIITPLTGTFQAENIKVGLNVVAAISGAGTDIAFTVPGGTFRFINANFGAGATTLKMYGVDGKNRGFEFDGTSLVFINTGMTVDAPQRVCFHKFHLFFSFNGSLQHSDPGFPLDWSYLHGAAELGVSDVITDIISLPGAQTTGTLAVYARNSWSILYGSGQADWSMTTFNIGAGAIGHTVQQIGPTIMLDDIGLTSAISTQNYGNFVSSSISSLIKTWITPKIPNATTSCIVRGKNQYRIFFSDKTTLYVTLDGNKVAGIMPVVLPVSVECICSSESATAGKEVIFFGSSNGYVYQMDSGTSFDGAVIEYFLNTGYDSLRAPHMVKRFRKLTFEASGSGYTTMNFGYDIDSGSSEAVKFPEEPFSIGLNAATFDSGLFFDVPGFYFDGNSIVDIPLTIPGSGKNISVSIKGSSANSLPIKISGVQVLYSPSRIIR